MLTTRQVALLTGYSRDYVIELCRNGELPAVQIEGRWFIKDEDVQSFRRKGVDKSRHVGVA